MGSLESVVKNTKEFDEIVKQTYERIAIETYGSKNPEGIAIFAYGSPGRIELIGGDSDADILFVESTRTEKSGVMRDKFKEALKNFDFSKIDIPPWRDLSEIDLSCFISLVEGNQVFEARSLLGDSLLINEVKRRQIGYNNLERQISNLVFNRLYFNQYFRQRKKGESINIKYCNGGSRDFLFFSWYDILDREIANEPRDKSYSPRVEVALRRMLFKDMINPEEYEETLDAVAYQMKIRGQLLALNKNSTDKGITVLDETAIKKLKSIGNHNVHEKFYSSLKPVQNVIDKIWKDSIEKGALIRYKEWPTIFWKTLEINEPNYEKLKPLIAKDKILRTSAIWGASESNQKGLFDKLAEEFKTAEDWITLASITCSPYCSPEILDFISEKSAKRKGYEYILRVISRNKNVSKNTLASIASDKRLDLRYKEVAIAALNGGYVSANNQV